MNPFWIPEEEPLELSQNTKEILYRSYLIARLQKAVNLLCTTAYKEIFTYTFSPHTFSCFSNAEILAVMRRIEHEKSFNALFKLWDDIIAYRKVYDATFSHEFARLIFILVQELAETLAHKGIFTQYFDTYEIEAFDIAYRFYVIKRLQPFLLELNKYNYKHLDFSFSHTLFSHKRILYCIDKLEKKKNVIPLLQLADDFCEFKYCHDMLFTREFLMFLLVLTKKYASPEAAQPYMYDKSSIEEILSVIDTHTSKLLHESLKGKENHTKLLYSLLIFIVLSSATIDISRSIFV